MPYAVGLEAFRFLAFSPMVAVVGNGRYHGRLTFAFVAEVECQADGVDVLKSGECTGNLQGIVIQELHLVIVYYRIAFDGKESSYRSLTVVYLVVVGR